MPNETITVTLTPDLAWYLRKSIQPGPFQAPHRSEVVAFRNKINDAILRFSDEPSPPEEIDIEITPVEGWMIDNCVDFDGRGGSGERMLLQVFRGFWSARFGLGINLEAAECDPPFVELFPERSSEGDKDEEMMV